MDWRKSSYSGGSGGNCIEVADHEHRVMVRDTNQNATGPTLRFTPAAWRRFAEQVKRSLALDPSLESSTGRGHSHVGSVPFGMSGGSGFSPVRFPASGKS